MTSVLVDLDVAEGHFLATPILQPCGRKILAKGHRLEASDLATLASEGLQQVWVIRLDQGDREENAVLDALIPLAVRGAVDIRRTPGGRADFHATQDSALIVHPEPMGAINRSGVAVMCTQSQFRYLRSGERIAALRARPFAAPALAVDQLAYRLGDLGPAIEVKPIREPRLGVIYTDPANPDRARTLFEPAVRARMARYSLHRTMERTARESADDLRPLLEDFLRRKTDVVLVPSTISPATPDDVLGFVLAEMGATIEHFLAPIEPGSLLMLAYLEGMAVVSAPGCFRSPKDNGLDLILPPLIARHRVGTLQVSNLGAGGLLGM